MSFLQLQSDFFASKDRNALFKNSANTENRQTENDNKYSAKPNFLKWNNSLHTDV